MPRISIIVPVYKAEQYLDTCVESILRQTYTDFELILVDDGSPDKCPEKCDAYAKKDKRIKVIHQKNAGVAIARNKGLDVAIGEYAAFVDSDDYIEPNMYQEMMEVLEKYKCELVICDCLKENQNWTEIYTHNIRAGYYNEEQLVKEYYPHLLIMPNIEYPATISNWVCLFKIKAHIRYEAGIRFSEDWLFGAQLMVQAKSFYYMKGKTYYHYRMNEQSVTHTFVPDKWNDYCKLYKRIKNEFSVITNFDFDEQIDKVLLFLVYNAIDDLMKTKHLAATEKNRKIREILDSHLVREMFSKISILKLPIRIKLKIQTLFYKYSFLVGFLIKYYERR